MASTNLKEQLGIDTARNALHQRLSELMETDQVLVAARAQLAAARAGEDGLTVAEQLLHEAADPPGEDVAPGARTLGMRLADAFHAGFATWWFVIAQSLLIAVWIAFNAFAWARFDKFPFLFLNLAFSVWAAYAAPLILMADARAADRDRHRIEEQTRQMAAIARMLERYAPPQDHVVSEN